MNFDHAINEFRRYLQRNHYSENTIKKYCETIQQTLKDINLDTLNQNQINEIATELSEKYQPNGNRTRYSAINLFCKKVLKNGSIYLKIPYSRVKNKDVLTNEQVEEIIKKTKTKKKCIQSLILTLYDEALRKMEACNLNINDIDFDNMEISLRNTKTGDKLVTMTSRVAESIRDYLLYERDPANIDEKALFLNKYGKRIGESFVRNHLKECAIEAGITKRVYPHMLRASCITHLLNQGVNPLTVQEHARHGRFETTMRYNRPTQQQMKADIERIFVRKKEIDEEDRIKAVVDKYIRGEITSNELHAIISMLRPKQLNPKPELSGYA